MQPKSSQTSLKSSSGPSTYTLPTGVPTDHPGVDPGQAQGARSLPRAVGEVKFGPFHLYQEFLFK